MNTNQLKKFAQAARVKLIEQVTAKLDYVLTHDTAELRGRAETVRKLKDEIATIGKPALIDKVAYTWFNRFIALRFMDANGFQPLGYNVVTAQPSQVSPQILDEAHAGHISDELVVNKQTVLDLLDGRVPSGNPDNDAYRLLLVASCNHLSSILPFLFERINDYTELLLPDDLTSNFSIVKDVVDGMSYEDCKEVEIIGWLYQFYISQRKDEVFATKKAVSKEDIPAATQLFTPRWIVEYMVQNTLGKLWLQNKPGSKLKDHMPYYIESPSSQSKDYLKVNSVEEIKLLDQACGSGHILVYGFELLVKIYEEEGYPSSDIPQLIIEKNLYGFEIDERAAQLAGMALMMKARGYYRRFFKKEIKPNILCFNDLKLKEEEIADTFNQVGVKLTDDLKGDLNCMLQATNFGSLIRPKVIVKELEIVLVTFIANEATADLFLKHKIVEIIGALKQLILLGSSFHCVVDNPPYMGSGNMNKDLSDFVKINYPKSKSDLYSCFILRGIEAIQINGFCGMVTMESWMFLSSFEDLRRHLLTTSTIVSLNHFGWHIMRIAFGTVSFVIQKTIPESGSSGVYSYMKYDNINKDNERPIVFPIKNNGRYKLVNQNDFKKLPGSPIGYWLSEKAISVFDNEVTIDSLANVLQGMIPGNTDAYLRLWSEVQLDKIGFGLSDYRDSGYKIYKWFPYNKGGGFRRWFGNIEHVINMENDGYSIKHDGYNNNYRLRDPNVYFKTAITWSKISSGAFSMRKMESGHLFDIAGCCAFTEDNIEYLLAFSNSKVCSSILNVISPTLNYEVLHIKSLPILFSKTELISELSSGLQKISKEDWNVRETSWDFVKNELLRIKGQDLEETYDFYQLYWRNKYLQMHKCEEELNRHFIEIYGLEGEIAPDVPLEEITILKEETSIENGKLMFHEDVVFQQFLSYAVGCLFGRYSLDKDGLILATQSQTIESYFNKVGRSESELSFIPDEDNIIPFLDDEWFEDDIVSRFNEFLKVSFGEKNLRKNLAFVEECLGKGVRQYFTKDFYKDHVQRYKKRPIYWMFSSPKGYFNVLIYMHRYTPDTLNIILNSYLREFIEKLELQRKQLLNQEASGSATEQNKARKQIDKIDAMLADCRQYEVEILYPLASERIEIDLDDGVLVNYNKFGKAIAPVDGLNDAKTKKKVREFDWIDTTKIK
jgi:hypothetical protein